MRIARPNRNGQTGFTLLETMVGAVVFLIICGAVMGLLTVSQKRYKTDTQVLSAFQEARLAIDQMTRDIDDAGYPPASQFSTPGTPTSSYTQSPFGWFPNYPTTACTIGGSCTTPGDFDLIVESDVDNSGTVYWVRYQLQGTTLYRGIVAKTVGGDPNLATLAPGVMAPYVQNVMNNASSTQITALDAAFPNLFPGGNPVPIFTYSCDTSNGPATCSGAGTNNYPANIREVGITLIVQAPGVDAQTGQIRAISLNALARRINPNQ